MLGPSRLAITNEFQSKPDFLRKEFRATGRLRVLLPDNEYFFIQDFISEKLNISQMSNLGKNNKSKNGKNKWVKEILIFNSNGTSINQLFYEVVQNLQGNNKEDRLVSK